jgi:hypothetical protein
MKYSGLSKIISGGQTGADQGGLVAAFKAGLLTGGTAPSGFYTSVGPNYLLSAFGLKDAGTLQTRTKMNIKDSDATVICTVDSQSAGSYLTRRLCRELAKPVLELDLQAACAAYGDTGGVPGELVYALSMSLSAFVIEHQACTLNVAGNRERFPDGRVHHLTQSVIGHGLQILDLEGFLVRDADL